MTVMRKQPGTPKDVLVVVLSNVDVGDPRCPIHDNDAIFTQTLIKKVIINQRQLLRLPVLDL